MSEIPANAAKRVFLVDDHPMVRERLALLIDQQPDLQVCGEAGSALEAIQSFEKELPDIAIVDLSLKGSSGLELIKDIKARDWDIPILVLSMHDENLYAERVLRAGGFGFISKEKGSKDVLEAIRKVIDREVYVSEEINEQILRRMLGKTGTKISPFEKLADRELEVFQMIGRGHGTRNISEALGLSVKTVESYRARIKEKLQLDDGVQLLQQATLWVRSYDGL